MKRLVIVFLVLLIGLAWSGQNVDKFIKRVQKKYQKVTLLHIDFKQSNRFKLTGLQNEIFGTLWLSKQDKFRLDTEDQTIVSDGTTFWRFNKLENQVLIDHAKKSQQDVFINNFLFHISDRYFSQILSEQKVGKEKIVELKLTPRDSEESFFKFIKVWISDKTLQIKRVVYVDYNDNESEYVIEKQELNPPAPKSLFQFQIPQGMEVVDLRF